MARKYSNEAGRKVEKVMQERKAGTLKSGRSGSKVKSRKQAIAIGLSEARATGKKVPKKKSAKKKSAKNRMPNRRDLLHWAGSVGASLATTQVLAHSSQAQENRPPSPTARPDAGSTTADIIVEPLIA